MATGRSTRLRHVGTDGARALDVGSGRRRDVDAVCVSALRFLGPWGAIFVVVIVATLLTGTPPDLVLQSAVLFEQFEGGVVPGRVLEFLNGLGSLGLEELKFRIEAVDPVVEEHGR